MFKNKYKDSETLKLLLVLFVIRHSLVGNVAIHYYALRTTCSEEICVENFCCEFIAVKTKMLCS